VGDRPTDQEPEPGTEPAAEADALDLDTSGEPEPAWAEAIRRRRKERAELLREQLQPREDPPLEPPE
jgi:hypothetical protein